MAGSNRQKVIDPVCGMALDPDHTARIGLYGGRRFYFCSPKCQDAFNRKPECYTRPKGFIGRWLDKMARANDREFGPGGPCCH